MVDQHRQGRPVQDAKGREMIGGHFLAKSKSFPLLKTLANFANISFLN